MRNFQALEGMNSFLQDILFQSLVQSLGRGQIDLSAKDILQETLQPGQGKQSDMRTRLEIDQDVDIAVRSCLALSN